MIEKLLQHGIAVEELTAPLTTEVESFVIDSVKKAGRPFQGHTTVTLTGNYKKETMTFRRARSWFAPLNRWARSRLTCWSLRAMTG